MPITTANSTSQSVFLLPLGIINSSLGPTIAEVAIALDKPLEKLQKLLNYGERVSSLDITIGKEGNSPLVNFVSEESELEPDEAINDEAVYVLGQGYLEP